MYPVRLRGCHRSCHGQAARRLAIRNATALRIALTALGTSLLVQACAPTRPPASATTAPSQPTAATGGPTINVLTLPFISFAPLYIAQDMGFYAAQGLQVNLVEMTVQQDAIAALVSDQVDVSSAQVSVGMFNAIAKGSNIRFIADKGYIDPASCNNIALLARSSLVPEGAPITADVLRGRSIDMVRTTWNEFYVDRALASTGLRSKDLQDQALASPSVPEAMSSGKIDLSVQNEPWVTRLKDAGSHPILSPTTELFPDGETAALLFGPKLLGANAETGNRFMQAYLLAVRQYNLGKTDDNVRIISKATQLDEATLRRMCWPTIRADGGLNTQNMVDFENWAVEQGYLSGAVPEAQFYEASFARTAVQRLDH